MHQAQIALKVRRVSDKISVLDVRGEVTAFAEKVLMEAYADAGTHPVRVLVLNFSELEYMNSGGIGLLVTLLIRANRHGQRLLAVGLTEHYRHIFELTRLDEAIHIYESEAEALAAANAA